MILTKLILQLPKEFYPIFFTKIINNNWDKNKTYTQIKLLNHITDQGLSSEVTNFNWG